MGRDHGRGLVKDSPSPERVRVFIPFSRTANSYRKHKGHGIRGTGLLKTIRSIKVSREFQPTSAAPDMVSTKGKKARKGEWPIRTSGRSGLDILLDQHHWIYRKWAREWNHIYLTITPSLSILPPYFKGRRILSPKICALKPSLICMLFLCLHPLPLLWIFSFGSYPCFSLLRGYALL